MEGEQRWNSFTFGVAIPPPSELNCFLNPNCDTSMDRNDPFQSAISSLVSSPAASNAGAGDGFVFRELIGKLGSICNSGENSPQSRKIDSTNNSCYTTPLNSPPILNLSSLMETRTRGNFGASVGDNQVASLPGFSPLNADPGFVERAAKFSCFGSRNLDGLSAGQFGSEMGYGSLPKLESGNLSRVSSNSCIKLAGPQETLNSEKTGDMGDSREGSSVSEQNPGGELGVKAQNNTNSRKRKAIPKSKGHVKEEKVGRENDESSCAKRSKPEEDAKKEKANTNEEQSGNVKDSTKDGDQKQNKEAAKPQEPLKDYIHVRARRGQATDSHSLAERVRREKISERMKFLQDLVPGCNKVTGKAVVLDEIINYVQSLQRQVEFLSMKLATVNPRMDVNMEALLSKDMLQLPSTMFPDSSASAFPYGLQPQQLPTPLNGLHSGNPAPFSINPMDTATRQNAGIQMHSTGLYGDSAPQIPSFWEDDLHSLVQMGFPQNQMQNFQGTIPATRMKTEL